MKIGRSYPRRRKAVPATLLDATIVEGKIEPWREPQRKALLIGINYGGQVEGQRGMQLMGPHRDVQAMKKLLMGESFSGFVIMKTADLLQKRTNTRARASLY